MRRTRVWLLAIVLILISLLTTAYVGPALKGQPSGMAEGDAQASIPVQPTVKLPRIILDYGDDGVPRLLGVSVPTIGTLLGVDLSFLDLPPAVMERLIAGNIQHLEIETTEEGVMVYSNGNPLPYLAWDEALLDRVGDLIVVTGAVPKASVLDKLMPLLPHVGIDLALRFPTAEGVTPLSLRDRSERVLATPVEIEPSAVINLVVSYSSAGVPSVAGITDRDLQALLGMNLSFLELSPATLQALRSAQIQRAEVITTSDGLHVRVDGEDVLHLAYSQDHLMNAVEVLQALVAENPIVMNLSQLIPTLYAANIHVTLEFPTGQ